MVSQSTSWALCSFHVHSPAISSVPNFMLSAAGDNKAEGFKGWLFLD
jgi:hypothetical protein